MIEVALYLSSQSICSFSRIRFIEMANKKKFHVLFKTILLYVKAKTAVVDEFEELSQSFAFFAKSLII